MSSGDCKNAQVLDGTGYAAPADQGLHEETWTSWLYALGPHRWRAGSGGQRCYNATLTAVSCVVGCSRWHTRRRASAAGSHRYRVQVLGSAQGEQRDSATRWASLAWEAHEHSNKISRTPAMVAWPGSLELTRCTRSNPRRAARGGSFREDDAPRATPRGPSSRAHRSGRRRAARLFGRVFGLRSELRCGSVRAEFTQTALSLARVSPPPEAR